MKSITERSIINVFTQPKLLRKPLRQSKAGDQIRIKTIY